MNNPSLLNQLKTQTTPRQLTRDESAKLLSEIKSLIPSFINELDSNKSKEINSNTLKELNFCAKLVRDCLSTLIISDLGKSLYLQIFDQINKKLGLGKSMVFMLIMSL